jgi:hypothetical protein
MKALNSAGSYIKNSFDYALKGDYSKNFNVLGMILNVGIGLIPVVGQAADVRDLSYALTHTKENSTWGNIALIGLALIAFIPLFGDVAKNLKYAKYLGTAGDALKQLDNIGDAARGIANNSDEIADAAKQVGGVGEIRPDFYVKPDGVAVPATGYRYMDSGHATEAITQGKQYSTYFGFENFDSAAAARNAYQISPSWSDAKVIGEFDTLQVIDDMYVPTTLGNSTSILEPFASSYPDFGTGGAQQFRADKVLEFLNVRIIGD